MVKLMATMAVGVGFFGLGILFGRVCPSWEAAWRRAQVWPAADRETVAQPDDDALPKVAMARWSDEPAPAPAKVPEPSDSPFVRPAPDIPMGASNQTWVVVKVSEDHGTIVLDGAVTERKLGEMLAFIEECRDNQECDDGMRQRAADILGKEME